MITPQNLLSRLGRETWPEVLDVRAAKDVGLRPVFLPGARPASPKNPPSLERRPRGKPIVVYCTGGCGRSEQTLKKLKARGLRAHILAGGLDAWLKAGGPVVGSAQQSLRSRARPSRWITRARPKIDRIACPWLIRRFLDPQAVFFYADPARIKEEARRLKATSFDIPGDSRFSHEGEACSFDYFIKHFKIRDPALDELAVIVRGADTARLDLAHPSAGLLSLSLGLSALYADDQVMLKKGMLLYDALYAWIRFASEERHNWPKPVTEKAA